jgi:integrase
VRTKTSGVFRKPDGTAKINIFVTVPGLKRRIHIRKAGIASVAIAKEMLPALVDQRERKAGRISKDVLFEDLVEEYLAHRKAQNLAAQSLEGIEFMLRKYAVSCFNGRFIGECLSARGIYRWYETLASAGKPSIKRKNKVFGEMRMLISFARKLKYIDAETCDDAKDIIEAIKNPMKPTKTRPTWTKEEAERFLSAIPKDNQDFVLFSLELWLGARKSELLGLQRSCHHDGRIDIRQQIIRVKDGWELSPRLKSGNSYRTDPVPPELDSILSEYENGRGIRPDGFLFFVSDQMVPLSKTELARRQRVYEKAAGVPHIGPHGIRHTRIKLFKDSIRTAAEAQAASRFIGHSVTVDMNVYGKADDSDVERFVRKYGSSI